MEYIKFIITCIRCGTKNTLAWSKDNKVWLRLYFIIASAIVLGLQSKDKSFWAALVASAGYAIAILGILILSVLVAECVKAPAELRRNAFKPPSITIIAKVHNDVLHQQWLSLRDKLMSYKQWRPHKDLPGPNQERADAALKALCQDIENFGVFAHTVTLDKVSIKRRRAARKMYREIRGVSHETSLDILEEEMNKFSNLW